MKFVTVIVLSIFFSFLVQAKPDNAYGRFTRQTETYFHEETREDCDTQGGRFEDGLCFIAVKDEVSITAVGGAYSLSALVWGPESDSCEFQAQAQFFLNTLVGRVKDLPEQSFCELRVRYINEDTITVNQRGDGCLYLCGPHAKSFEIDRAMREQN